MNSFQAGEKITLELSKNEALVLLDWLFRFNEKDNPIFFEDQAEKRVLWDMESVLEKNTPDVFDSNYAELLSNARAEIRDKE